MRLPPSGDHTGHGEGRGPAARRDGRAVTRPVRVEIGAGRRAPGRVEGEQAARARVVDQPEVVAADPVHVRIDDGDGGGRGEGRVEGVAAAREDGAARLGGQMMGRGHEAARGARLGPAGGSAHAPMIAPLLLSGARASPHRVRRAMVDEAGPSGRARCRTSRERSTSSGGARSRRSGAGAPPPAGRAVPAGPRSAAAGAGSVGGGEGSLGPARPRRAAGGAPPRHRAACPPSAPTTRSATSSTRA